MSKYRDSKSVARHVEKTSHKFFPPKLQTDTSPHLIVEARAGTGKTTTMIEGLRLLRGLPPTIVPSPQQKAVWDSMLLSFDHAKSWCFVAFNKSIATELQQRVPPGVDAFTMHSMSLRAVTSTYGKVAINANRVDDIVVALLPQYTDVWDLRRKRPGLIPLVKELVGLCKMNLLEGTPEECYGLMSHHAMNPGDDDTVTAEAINLVGPVLEGCADVERDRQIDFDDMVWLPVKNKLVIRKYDLLLVDEVQDLSRVQQELAKKAGRRLVLVGDPHQAIYGFAGADSESMKRMKRDLDTTYHETTTTTIKIGDGRGCVVLPLTVTRRCGKAIVEEARKLVPDFEAHESNGPGKISREPLNEITVHEETPNLNKQTQHYMQKVQDGDMVLCRLNAPLVSEAFKFIKAGRRANIQGRDIGQGLVTTVKATKAETITELIHGLSRWLDSQVAKERAKKHPSENRLLALQDRYDCIMCFVEGQTTVTGVLERIQAIFTDGKDAAGIRLSSIHRAKGLEALRVFFIQTPKTRKVREMAKTPMQKQQEDNLQYVATTRAIKELVYVS